VALREVALREVALRELVLRELVLREVALRKLVLREVESGGASQTRRPKEPSIAGWRWRLQVLADVVGAYKPIPELQQRTVPPNRTHSAERQRAERAVEAAVHLPQRHLPQQAAVGEVALEREHLRRRLLLQLLHDVLFFSSFFYCLTTEDPFRMQNTPFRIELKFTHIFK
jgi:hypothetical protein